MSAESIVGLISGGSGALGVMVIWMSLLLSGKLHTNSEVERLEKELDREVTALDRERAAHEETRRALAAADDRADAAVKASSIIADSLSAARVSGGSARRAIPGKS